MRIDQDNFHRDRECFNDQDHETKRENQAALKKFAWLTLAGAIVHILLPVFLKNQEVYFFSMPLPWTTAPL